MTRTGIPLYMAQYGIRGALAHTVMGVGLVAFGFSGMPNYFGSYIADREHQVREKYENSGFGAALAEATVGNVFGKSNKEFRNTLDEVIQDIRAGRPIDYELQAQKLEGQKPNSNQGFWKVITSYFSPEKDIGPQIRHLHQKEYVRNIYTQANFAQLPDQLSLRLTIPFTEIGMQFPNYGHPGFLLLVPAGYAYSRRRKRIHCLERVHRG
jgi:hypothetical protein